jgi:hypothetical protein
LAEKLTHGTEFAKTYPQARFPHENTIMRKRKVYAVDNFSEEDSGEKTKNGDGCFLVSVWGDRAIQYLE